MNKLYVLCFIVTVSVGCSAQPEDPQSSDHPALVLKRDIDHCFENYDPSGLHFSEKPVVAHISDTPEEQLEAAKSYFVRNLHSTMMSAFIEITFERSFRIAQARVSAVGLDCLSPLLADYFEIDLAQPHPVVVPEEDVLKQYFQRRIDYFIVGLPDDGGYPSIESYGVYRYPYTMEWVDDYFKASYLALNPERYKTSKRPKRREKRLKELLETRNQ